jgi:chromosome transmission fidelity protein 8
VSSSASGLAPYGGLTIHRHRHPEYLRDAVPHSARERTWRETVCLTVVVVRVNWIWVDLVVVVQSTSDLVERNRRLFNMPPIPIHCSPAQPDRVSQNPLPSLLQTPSGLALLELQGTINLPAHPESSSITVTDIHNGATSQEIPIGRLVFPDYEEGKEGQQWMKRVYLYVGKNQRLTGEVKKLPRAIAVIRRRDLGTQAEGDDGTELEIVELIKFKVLFSSRPEPVGALSGA